jgi:hypothetical protein
MFIHPRGAARNPLLESKTKGMNGKKRLFRGAETEKTRTCCDEEREKFSETGEFSYANLAAAFNCSFIDFEALKASAEAQRLTMNRPATEDEFNRRWHNLHCS